MYKVLCLNDDGVYVWASVSKSWTDLDAAERYASTIAECRKALVVQVG
jgi:hypothetical protein